jgi:hypothetical protein
MTYDTNHSRYHLEAKKIFLSIFNRVPSAVVVDRFIEISSIIENDYSIDEINFYHRIVERIDDLEAAEYICRLTRKHNLIVKKMLLMVYLAETRPENQYLFINNKNKVLIGPIALLVSGLYTIAKAVKGYWLIKRFEDA